MEKSNMKSHKYIQSVKLNWKPVDGFQVPQSEVLKGGKLEIIMK